MMKPEISKKILGKNYKKRKKQQSTESQRNIKYRNISNDGPVFRFSLPGGGVRTAGPRQLRQWF